METKDLIAESEITVDAPIDHVWDALINPETIKKYMFGTVVSSDWKVGSPISWKGEWKGKPYEDKGQLLAIDSPTRLQYSHFSPLSGQADTPANYHTVTIDLSDQGAKTHVTLTQDKNATEEAREHSKENWSTMLSGLKKVLENNQ